MVSSPQGHWQVNLPWPSISIANRDAIQASLPTLTSLALFGIDELPLTLLSHCSSLRSLTLDTVTFSDNPGSATAPERRTFIQLQSLTLRDLNSDSLQRFVSWATCPESSGGISYLRSLDCNVDNPNSGFPIQRLLNALCPHSYTWKAELMLTTSKGPLDLHKLVHLHTISLETHCPIALFVLKNFVISPNQQPLEVVYRITDENRTKVAQHLVDADRILAAMPLEIVTVVVFFWNWPTSEKRAEKLIDVADEFLPKMPLLASKLGGTPGALRILESM
ncbi:hypothetical protein MSAN_01231900 [Mycena sanguinolenta]|uniref:F-box domain-containing protein n=1 Tax=Mycena sanguinolenta TaxID=230812 RepID=A0A8H7D2C6_9AGAR|nr:hypothetical protein MSAN_01231900 [Mycena sanguinolenta]